MAGIQRLSVLDAAGGTAYGSGTVAFVATGDYLISVIATNTLSIDAEIYIYSVPSGSTTETEWALVAYKLPLPAYNSYETFRFGLNNGDTVYVAGSGGIRYFVQGIEQIG
jgi:hypothetical protein